MIRLGEPSTTQLKDAVTSTSILSMTGSSWLTERNINHSLFHFRPVITFEYLRLSDKMETEKQRDKEKWRIFLYLMGP